MSEHTPGPWDIEYGQLHPASETCGYTIRTDAFDVVSGHLAIRREADALLIAAAPDLLAERDRLTEDRRELVEALEWYADPDNYTRDSWGILSVVQAPDYGDPGATARATLDRIKARERDTK